MNDATLVRRFADAGNVVEFIGLIWLRAAYVQYHVPEYFLASFILYPYIKQVDARFYFSRVGGPEKDLTGVRPYVKHRALFCITFGLYFADAGFLPTVIILP